MKLIFSRKGLDSSSGGAPSPIIDNKLISIPIPTSQRSVTTYGNIGLGLIIENQTNNRFNRNDLCHADPLFYENQCAFGQTGASQSHLEKNGIGIGDVFLFFGLFQRPGGAREHWIYGYLQVTEIRRLGPDPSPTQSPALSPYQHPHTIGQWNANNTLYLGKGAKASHANSALKLTADSAMTSIWKVPPWLRYAGLTYHSQEDRWTDTDKLRIVGRGQEFVADIKRIPEASLWVKSIIEAIVE
ncbi:hypothetical protein [Bosea sp. 124]|uniref:Nmad3 family putative nucleotide modification protein n=1 Tax=Bosea sp. 124 TaxID=2135642 RepID=UPI000D43E726|nr:hypothetical protein [Bosea sp. 124]PTM39802.1 hypothetical protein C8D03_1307 [Bosea sp. 124]